MAWPKNMRSILIRTKEGIHNVIVYCKGNPDKTVINAISMILKEEKKK